MLSLMMLSKMPHEHHCIKPLVIIDEYDPPIQQGYYALGGSTLICTIMNLIALDDVSLLSKISCFERLVEFRYYGVLSYSFFHVVNKQLNKLKQDGNLDTYEALLDRLINAVGSILDEKDPFLGDMRELLKHYFEVDSLPDDLPSLLMHLFICNLPVETLTQILSKDTNT